MTSLISEKVIAVIGDEDFTEGFKLGGVAVTFTINTRGQSDEAIRTRIRGIVSKVFENHRIGIVIIEENLRRYVEAFQRVTARPLIIYLPRGLELEKSKIKEYYNSLIRAYLGLSIEV